MTVASKQMFSDGQSFPWDERLEWLKTDDRYSQRIDTGISIKDGLRTVLKFSVGRTPDPLPQIQVGADYGDSVLRHAWSVTSQMGIQFGFGPGAEGIGYDNSTQRRIQVGAVTTIDAWIFPDQQKLLMNGETVYEHQYSGYRWNDVQLQLFDYNANGTMLNRKGQTSLYSCQVLKQDSTMIADFIPCVKDGVVCLYDAVRKQFSSTPVPESSLLVRKHE